MPSKVWVSGYLGLRYWVPMSRIVMREGRKAYSSPVRVSRMKEPRHPAFPVEELSRHLTNKPKEADSNSSHLD